MKGESTMEITDIKITKAESANGKLLAFASVVIDKSIAIHNIRLINNEGKRFLSFPGVKTSQGKIADIVHPINTETRAAFEKAIFDEFDKAE